MSWLLLVLFMIQKAPAANVSVDPQRSVRSQAFARYIAWLQQRDPLTESGPVAVLIEASLPGLYKEAELLAIRETGEDERGQYHILGIEGDGTVAAEVIARYFALEKQMEDLPLSSVLIAPANYKFNFRGEVKTAGENAYVYDITPKKSRPGLIKGQLWMDSGTGAEVIVTGRLTDMHSIGGVVDLVRETTLIESTCARVTHLSFALPLLGRSELVITEYPLLSHEDFRYEGAPRSQGCGVCGDSGSVPDREDRRGSVTPLE